MLGQTVTCTLSGYAFAMVEFPGRNAIFAVFLATMMVPLQTIIIPVFVIIRYLGLSDSLMSLVVSALGNAFGTFLMRQYFMQMPRELGEAARIDGAGHFQVFFSVYAKMAGPAIATLAILNFSAFWAEFYRPLIFLQSQDNFTLPARPGRSARKPGHRIDLGGARRRDPGHAAERDLVHLRPAILHRRRHSRVFAMSDTIELSVHDPRPPSSPLPPAPAIGLPQRSERPYRPGRHAAPVLPVAPDRRSGRCPWSGGTSPVPTS